MTSRIDVFAKDLGERVGRDLTDYADLWEYSVTDLSGFWRAVWDFVDFDAIAAEPLGDGPVLADASMPGASWFPTVRLNYVDAVLAHADRDGVAIVGVVEDGQRVRTIDWRGRRRSASRHGGHPITIFRFTYEHADAASRSADLEPHARWLVER
ncbi:acetyl-coenzyme A synthetase N-terminal domain-containing protein [Gordonia humi]|uniref:Acetyl-coenzyme A synthetase N-terminal domain-containing protein n=1 Tax=Gordonia humi TaxID=686429 RepID=A0A840F1L4_9ACTN|nr:acetyl-coenzyme A synthetase N-terminal domain-containing protein [Gordonia humi]MBB4137762.1 hypothetical protein [Gordonia humi]